MSSRVNPQLKGHLRGALNGGATVDEVKRCPQRRHGHLWSVRDEDAGQRRPRGFWMEG